MATTCHCLLSAHTKTVDLKEVSRPREEDSDADDSDSNLVDPSLLRGSLPTPCDTLRGTQQEYGSTNVNAEATSPLCHSKKRPRYNGMCCTFLEWLCLSTCLILTAAFFITPLLFQYFYVNNTEMNNTETNISSCATYGNCFALREALPTGMNCTAVPYTGRVCKCPLSLWQKCVIDSRNDELSINFIGNNQTANRLEQHIKVLQNHSSNSSECQDAAVQLACQHTFPLCDNNTEASPQGKLLLPSRDQCLHVKETICKMQQNILQYLPDCDQLPPAHNLNDLNCSKYFFKRHGRCLPDCFKFVSVKDEELVFWNTVFPMLLGVGLLAAIGVCAVFASEHKKLCTFPMLYILFISICWMIPGIVVLIGRMDRRLFCHSQELKLRENRTTSFCAINGAVIHWSLLSAQILWLFHVSTMFFKVVRPSVTLKEQKWTKWIHITLSILGCLAPLPAVLTGLTGYCDSGYVLIAIFPPLACVPTKELVYYSVILPFNFISGIGVTALLLTFWLVYKYQGILKAYTTARSRLSPAEIKILFLICYYALFSVVVLFQGEIEQKTSPPFNLLQDYFSCEERGLSHSCSTKLSVIKNNIHCALSAPVLVLLICIPVVNLVFILSWRKVGSAALSLFTACCKRVGQSITNTLTLPT